MDIFDMLDEAEAQKWEEIRIAALKEAEEGMPNTPESEWAMEDEG